MTTGNRLHWFCALGGVLVGAMLMLGAFGHFDAVKASAIADDGGKRFWLILPSLILGGAGLLNIVQCKLLWDGNETAQKVAITGNLLALSYLIYLLWKGVPDHPVGMFTAIVACYLVLLVVAVFGPSWPAGN